MTPGLIDAHSHPVYAGNRWAELTMLAGGSTAAEINSAGGGISSTVTVTRGTDPWTLCNGVRERLNAWLMSGTTTVEAKTGYHLTRDGELADVRMLRSLESEPGMPRMHVTFLAAHSVPPEFFGRRADYIDAVSSWCPDAAAAGADSVDVYCEDGRFTEAEARWILSAGRRSGLLPRIHACGQSRIGAARLAAEIGCASADMLHAADDDDVAALARAGVATVVCPSTSLQTHGAPPVRALLDKGVAVALGSDHTPGGNGITSMSPGHLAGRLALRDERHGGAAGRDDRWCPRAPGPRSARPWPAAATRTSCSGTPTTRARSSGLTASIRTASGGAASPSRPPSDRPAAPAVRSDGRY